jgi:hypothetical protein
VERVLDFSTLSFFNWSLRIFSIAFELDTIGKLPALNGIVTLRHTATHCNTLLNLMTTKIAKHTILGLALLGLLASSLPPPIPAPR